MVHLNTGVVVCVFSTNISYQCQLRLFQMYWALGYLRVCKCKMCKYILNGARRPDTALFLFLRLLNFIVSQAISGSKILTSSLLLLAFINAKSNIYLVSWWVKGPCDTFLLVSAILGCNRWVTVGKRHMCGGGERGESLYGMDTC